MTFRVRRFVKKKNHKTMDTSDDERLILLRRKKKRSRPIWCREHYVLRATCGEYIRTFRSLLDNRDEVLFFSLQGWHMTHTKNFWH